MIGKKHNHYRLGQFVCSDVIISITGKYRTKNRINNRNQREQTMGSRFFGKNNKMDVFLRFQFTFGFGKFRNKGNYILNIILGSPDWGKTILKKVIFNFS